MSHTVIRGGALTGARLCPKCASKYFEWDTENKPECRVCGRKILEAIGVALCRFCSAEMGVCQGAIDEDEKGKETVCSAPLSTDIEELKKARRGVKAKATVT